MGIPTDKITLLRALEIIGEMCDSASDCSGDDPEDEDMAEEAEALNVAWHALNDIVEQQGGKG